MKYSIDLERMVTMPNVSVGAFTTGIVTHEGKKCGISEKRAHSLAALGLNMCYFSVYSTQAKKHDWMTENEGSFALTLESIKNMCEQNIEVKGSWGNVIYNSFAILHIW